MYVPEWHSWSAFDESRKFLTDPQVPNDRLIRFEMLPRRVLGQLEELDKLLKLSETGSPSATRYIREAENLIIPINENELFQDAMQQFVGIIRSVNFDYQGVYWQSVFTNGVITFTVLIFGVRQKVLFTPLLVYATALEIQNSI